MDERRLADCAMAFSASARRPSTPGAKQVVADFALEDFGQPASKHGGPDYAAVVYRGLDGVARLATLLDARGCNFFGVPCLRSRHQLTAASSARHSMVESFLEHLGRHPHQHGAVCSFADIPRPPGVSAISCYRSYFLSQADFQKETSRMGD